MLRGLLLDESSVYRHAALLAGKYGAYPEWEWKAPKAPVLTAHRLLHQIRILRTPRGNPCPVRGVPAHLAVAEELQEDLIKHLWLICLALMSTLLWVEELDMG